MSQIFSISPSNIFFGKKNAFGNTVQHDHRGNDGLRQDVLPPDAS